MFLSPRSQLIGSVHKATPSDNMEKTARSGAVVETIFLSRPRRAQCKWWSPVARPTCPLFKICDIFLFLTTLEVTQPIVSYLTGPSVIHNAVGAGQVSMGHQVAVV